MANTKEPSIPASTSDDDNNYISLVHNYNRLYTKYMPQLTGVYDDFLFTGFEYNHFIKPKVKRNDLKSHTASTIAEFDLEKELCIKCENINIREKESHSEASSASVSPTTQMIRSIEQELAKTSEVEVSAKEFHVLQLDTPTSNMPINLVTVAPLQQVEEAPVRIAPVEPEHSAVLFKRQSSSTMLVSASTSASSAVADSELKPKKKTYKQRRRPDTASMATPQPKHLKTSDMHESTPSQTASKMAVSTAKKRNAVETGDQLRETEHRTPVSKRRLVLTDQAATTAAAVASPMRTILHYFSPKPPPRP